MNKSVRLTKLKSANANSPIDATSLSIRDLEGIARPMNDKTDVVTTRFSGAWLHVWNGVLKGLPGVSPSEIIRQSVALRAALIALDGRGQKVKAKIIYVDDSGETIERDLEELVGLVEKQK
jgi:hypothetical protein